ncbi:MAG: hypothetical protein A2X25_09465 [Chloroflexi bacterium GWB2_49_20]|nr:MAG: hypothetical protein A2X25_09465 [Chloroflexi bacterium GWB2_49_20]OGN79348.1 MAG: hypothetical protein A2X26_04560 [Chloroflexi bacterium GWC2_49_37]OGN82882.1 MAG: hypothetical protein A2X27_08135 [Chloroflexi bacterium GWD2_49_16]
MKNNIVHLSIIFYLLIVGLVYVPTIGLWGNIAGLRAMHVDIPPSASDAAFQVKALANFLAGVILLTGCAGLLRRQAWGIPVTVIGLLCQINIYIAEIIIFRYLNAMGAAAVVIPLDAVIIYHLLHEKEI